MKKYAISFLFLALTGAAHGESITGQLSGYVDVKTTTWKDNQIISVTDVQNAPAWLDFTITTSGLPTIHGMAFYIAIYPYGFGSPILDTSPGYVYNLDAGITDGVPGVSPGSAHASGDYIFVKYGYEPASLSIIDPAGQYIGPNGNSDSTGVLANASILYDNEAEGFGKNELVQFHTLSSVPEPRSIVIVLIAIAILIAVGLATGRRKAS